MLPSRPLLFPALAALAACTSGGAGPYNETPSLGATKPFSATVGAVPQAKAIYGNRLGPTNTPWNDSVGGVVVPPRPGPVSTTVGTLGGGLEVLVGSVAVSTGSATVATDLDSGAEKWRLPTAQSFAPGLVTTDGTLVCGVISAQSGAGAAQCVSLATGAVAWTKPLGRTVSLIQGYGWPAEVRLHGDAFYVLGQGKLDVLALSDGTVRYSVDQRHIGQGLVFVGDDLVLSGASTGCASGSGVTCLRAVSPVTGATVAESPAPATSFLWSSGSTAWFLATPPGGGARSLITYDSSTHTFGEDAALLTALADTIGTNPRLTLFGLTPVLPNGLVYLGGGDASWFDNATSQGRLCRFNTKTRTKDACVDLSGRPTGFRVHPNFVPGGGTTLLPELGVSNVTTAALYFGRWAFIGGEVHVIH